jgi:hypothetical protein
MEHELKRIAVLQAGIVLAALYAIPGLIILVSMGIFMLAATSAGGEAMAAVLPMLPMMLMVLFYPALGFVGGMVMALLYNLSAGWVGGFRFEFRPFRGGRVPRRRARHGSAVCAGSAMTPREASSVR